MHYSEKLIELGQNGVLALTLGDAFYVPLPAQQFGYAEWRCLDGTVHDRMAVCTRVMSPEDIKALVTRQREKYVRAVASVRGRLDWVADQIADPYLEAPSHAYKLTNQLVLLLFTGLHQPHLLRIVNVERGTIVSEETANSLRARFNIDLPSYITDIAQPTVYADNAGVLLAMLGEQCCLLHAVDGQVELLRKLKFDDGHQLQLSRQYRLRYEERTGCVEIDGLSDDHRVAVYQPSIRKKNAPQLTVAESGERFVLSHSGGTLEVVDLATLTPLLMRPIARASSKDELAVQFSPDGRYLIAYDWRDACLMDLVESRSVAVTLPRTEQPAHQPDQFDAAIHYRLDWRLADCGAYVLYKRELTLTTYADFTWQPLTDVLVMPGRKVSNSLKQRLAAVVSAVRRPSIALRVLPALRGKFPQSQVTWMPAHGSYLYGSPQFVELADWPVYDGRPMVLLCQLELAELSKCCPDSGLPAHGGLLFFTAIDDEQQPVLDDFFNPIAINVRYVSALDSKRNPCAGPNTIPAQPIQFEIDPSELPQTDAAIIQGMALSDALLEQYRQLIEAKLPDGAKAGHRLGGYPHILQSNDLEASAWCIAHDQSPYGDCGDINEAAKWRLLLQLDGDDTFMWGTDSGMLYFLIHETDLAVADFSKVVALCAGY